MAKTLFWSRAYRADHWIRVLAIVLLVFTGFYIHWPFFGGGPESFIMATMRWIHFISAYVLVLGLIVRIYMAFNSKFDADWRDFNPWKAIKGTPTMLRYYFFLRPDHPEYRRYNPLQALTYFFWLLLIPIQALIGFAIYKGQFFGFFQSNEGFQFVTNFLGGESAARIWHFLIMWVFIITVGIHIYAALIQTWWQRDRTIASIVTGYKETGT